MKTKTDVLVVGGGPLGMFSAICLAAHGLEVIIADSQSHGAVHSRALALHPETLRLLDKIGVAEELVRQGHRIETLAFYEGEQRRAEIEVGAIGGSFPFVLVVSQSALETALERVLRQHGLKVLRNHEVLTLEPKDEGVVAEVARMEKVSLGYDIMRTDWEIGRTFRIRARYVVGADGRESRVRSSISRPETLGQTERFAVFEFLGPLNIQHEVRVVLANDSSNVLWPIGAERGRWSFQRINELPKQAEEQHLVDLARVRAPWFQVQPLELHWSARVHFDRRLVSKMGRARSWLVGDAAHATSPIGVQSMNVGFREAHDLVERLSAITRAAADPAMLQDYDETWRARWKQLLHGAASLESSAQAWVAKEARRIVSSVPASGRDLDCLLEQLGITLEPVSRREQYAPS